MKRFSVSVPSFLLAALFFPTGVGAVGSSGLSAQVVGTRALGMANAFAGLADDPSANYLNPAGLTQLKGWQASLGISPTIVKSDFSGQGTSESLMDEWTVLPNLFITGQLSDRVTIGFGAHVPYGLATEWSKTGQMRYIATKSELSTLLYNSNIAFAATNKLSFAAGIDYLRVLNSHLEAQTDQSAAIWTDGSKVLEGDGGSWGYNLGALWKPFDKHSFGISYRSPLKTTIEGEAKLSGIAPALQGLMGGASYATPAKTEIPFPQIVLLGYHFKPNNKWSFLFDYEWTDWSKFKNLQINYAETDAGRLSLLNTGNPADYSWIDCHAFAVGTEYALPSQVKLRAGYSYQNSVVPERTFNPSLPENNGHNFSVGAGFPVKNKIVFDFAYYVNLYETRKVDSNVNVDQSPTSPLQSIDGTYKTIIHVLSFSATYKFQGLL